MVARTAVLVLLVVGRATLAGRGSNERDLARKAARVLPSRIKQLNYKKKILHGEWRILTVYA